jgi:ABC-type transport system involved in multi-copper enzyme maturation permease subunit
LAPANPVLARELKERMRTRRAPITICIYLTILAGIVYLVYQARTGDSSSLSSVGVSEMASVGRSVFEWLVFFMLLLVLFMVPGFTSGAIAGERERQTLVPLQVTLLRPRSILLGKIAASMAFLGLLIVATVPLLSISYLIGGVTISQVIKASLLVLATGVALACITAACSTFVRRVQPATVLSYAAALALSLGTFLAYGAAGFVDQSRGVDSVNPPVAILLPNPLMAAADVIGASSDAGLNVNSPFEPMKELLRRDDNDGDVVIQGGVAVDVGVGRGGPIAPIPTVVQGPDGRAPVGFDPNTGQPVFAAADDGFPFWAGSLLILGAVSVLAVALAARRLRTPANEER